MTIHQPLRRGLISVVILIGLILVGLISGLLLKSILGRRAEVAIEERRAQAEWLAESAIARASSRLAESTAYTGETWEISADELGGRGPGSVLIRIVAVPEHPDWRRVIVRADYPSDSSHRARRSLDVVLTVPPPSR